MTVGIDTNEVQVIASWRCVLPFVVVPQTFGVLLSYGARESVREAEAEEEEDEGTPNPNFSRRCRRAVLSAEVL